MTPVLIFQGRSGDGFFGYYSSLRPSPRRDPPANGSLPLTWSKLMVMGDGQKKSSSPRPTTLWETRFHTQNDGPLLSHGTIFYWWPVDTPLDGYCVDNLSITLYFALTPSSSLFPLIIMNINYIHQVQKLIMIL